MIKCNTGNLIQKAVKAFLFSISSILSNQGNRNTNDGIALAQTIEGALDETTNMLQRIRTLAVQAANGTNTAKDRKALQEEVDSLSYEITRIAQKTTFAGALVLDGGGANTLMRQKAPAAGNNPAKYEYFFQVGANAKDEITLECGGFKMNQIASQLDFLKWKDANGGAITQNDMSKSGLWCSNGANGKAYSALRWQVSSQTDAQNTLANIDKFIDFVDSKRAGLGAIQNHFPVISSPHKTSSKPDILAVLNSFERMATFRWFFCA
ncbi:hypothetical protein [Anaerobiospirillum succiniciproducens]|uniref:flagellin N-terminal helical domain-containing protein n=1 Tax=Anaerobiospirillum succiniciproducens TaxID=13335 RepID=UPI0023531243|nr:hypothetical protein [Anaerobiospirillum succiniciproducens]